MKPNIILLFKVDKLYNNSGTYFSRLLQYTKELFYSNQEIDYSILVNAYNLVLSTVAIMIADPKDKHSGSPELSVIAFYKAASKIAVVLSWNSTNDYNLGIERKIRSEILKAGAPENSILSFYGANRDQIIEGCLSIIGWSEYSTSLIEFENGIRMGIPKEITLKQLRKRDDQNILSDYQ